ncbi:transmembrane protein 53-like isoform X2 [Tigriopus californicus]|uniref:transmembrane protein 53-like isoform X2 n=1 Tax=Tigriopus californicus TaxID=6832 RepID=UPI0027DA96AA|nr:transmembrane protein 53-like isoform X2 [Tigriopus californicus]
MDRDEQEEARDALLDDGEDDMEFHITFPSPMAKDDEEIIHSDMIFVPKEDPEPVVYLLGWAGALDKHLSKYSKIYESTGCITIRYTAPAEYIFFSPEKINPLAKKLLDLIEEMSLEANPVFFHIFSNNGATVYQYMAENIRTNPNYQAIQANIRGHIFDSSPGRRTCSSFVKATSAVLGLMVNGSGEAAEAELFVYDYILKKDNGFGQPQLFLYSKTDDVILDHDVEEIAAAREKVGCDVTKICYDDSAHVQHFRTYRESYVSAVSSFVAKALRNEDNRAIRTGPQSVATNET